MSKIRMVQYGCGKMSEYTIRFADEKGIKIIGAFDIDESITGKDVGEVISYKKLNVLVKRASDFEQFIIKNKPNVCVITTRSLIKELEEVLTLCASNGVNAITICEEAFYPQNSSPKIYRKLDKLCKQNNCTITGTGYQDVFWGNLITTLLGATHSVKEIHGRSSYNVEDYGIALAKVHGAGLSVEDFDKEIASSDNVTSEERKQLIEKGEFLPSYMWNVCGWLTSQLDLTVVKQVQKCIPQIAKQDIYSETLQMNIKKGNCTGMSAVVTCETKQGITIVAECIGKVYDKSEFDQNDWEIIGEPSTRVIINRPNTVELTCATVINRIAELIEAPSGYYTTDKMPTNTIKFKY